MILYADKPRGEVTERTVIQSKDRCDECGQTPFIKAKKGSAELLFCLHDGRKHVPVLADKGWFIEDNTHLLLKEKEKYSVEEPEARLPKKDDGGSLAKLSS
jgi:hypothetical protein